MLKKIQISLIIASLMGLTSALQGAAEVYKIDTVHSGVSFKIRHFFTKMPGSFNKFSGEIHYDAENPEKSKTMATIEVSSVDTNNKKRDGHLMNEDFFTESKFPLMTFESTKWEKVGENKFKITGDLTMLGKTKSVVLDTELLGVMDGEGRMEGTRISGWSGKTTIDRRDWGMTYGAGTVGNEVEIEVNIQAHAKI